eukprot:scaffold94333_cov17-Tisochrysis_lutea.AAC.1
MAPPPENPSPQASSHSADQGTSHYASTQGHAAGLPAPDENPVQGGHHNQERQLQQYQAEGVGGSTGLHEERAMHGMH